MKSIWNKDGKLPGRNHLPGDLDTEVAVIGAGLAGILTAFYLAREGKEVEGCGGHYFLSLCLLQHFPRYWLCLKILFPAIWICGKYPVKKHV